jgi:hypothetical protein
MPFGMCVAMASARGYAPSMARQNLRPSTKQRWLGSSLAWLVARYRETTVWQGLSSATKKQRENILRQVIASAGDQPFAKITEATITAGRDRRASTPFQARHFLDTVRGLFRWALDARLVKIDPTAGVKNPSRAKGDGFMPWAEDDVAAYEKLWPVGTRQRVWLDVLL